MIKSSFRRFLVASITSFALVFSHLSPWFLAASAQADLQWDSGLTGISTQASGGNGTWILDNLTTNWYDPNANSEAVFASGSNVIFGGTAGTVLVDSVHSNLGTLTVGNITINAAGYVIAGKTASDVLTMGTGNIVANANATISVTLAGSSGLSLSGSGTLTLAGSNSFSGAINISDPSGTVALSISSDSNLGNSANAVNIGSAGNAGTLVLNGAVSSARSITLGAGGAAIDVTGANVATLSGTIGGAQLTKTDTGTLVLLGSNTYGATTISSGTLQVGNGGTAGSLGTGAVTDNSALVIKRRRVLREPVEADSEHAKVLFALIASKAPGEQSKKHHQNLQQLPSSPYSESP